MIHIEISEGLEPEFDPNLLEGAACEVMLHEHVDSEAEVTILLTGDEHIQELNRKFREIDEPTDVLSFPADFVDPDNEKSYLGDIIISLPRTRAQAAAGGHPIEDELKLLTVHGMLHLLGYDHTGEEDKQQMWAAQREILDQLGCSLSPS